MALLDVEDLTTKFHTNRGVVTAVDGVDLRIPEGEIVGLVGESGSGKSVLAESVMRLVEEPGRIEDGDVRLRGESLLDRSEAEMRQVRGGSLSMVFQDPLTSLNPTLTVGEQIAETVRLHQDVGESVGLPAEMKRKIVGASRNSEAWRRAIEMLEAVSIPEPESRASSFPHEFSGGMRQRAMIAMALSCEPDLLIADEPTTALDVTIQAQILDELEDLREAFDTSVLLITHDLAVIAETCDEVNVMYAGDVVERADAEELFADPQHPYTQALLDSTPRLEAGGTSLSAIPGSVPDLTDAPGGCRFAPRCPEATEDCTVEQPPEVRVGNDESDTGLAHTAKCLYRGQGYDAAARREEYAPAPTSADDREESRAAVGSADDATGDPILEVEGFEKHFDAADGLLDRLLGGDRVVRAVDGVDLTVREGETLAVVGESGCGKTTLGQAVLNLEQPTGGEVRFRDREIAGLSESEMRPLRRDMQMIFQDPAGPLNPRKTVGQILRAPLDVHDVGDSKEERRATVEDALERVGLAPSHVGRYPHQFSGGQQQRIGIARALMLEPELLVADEPVSALDVSVQAQILNLLESLKAEMGLSMLFITHDLSVVRQIADRVAVMYLGEVVETAPVEQFFETPRHPYSRTLLSAVPRIDPAARTERTLLEGTVPSPVDPPSGCRFHTRCPEVIPPADWPANQASFRAGFSFRTRVVEEGIDVDDVRSRLRSEGQDVTEASVVDYLQEVTFDGDVDALPDAAAEAVRTATREIAAGEPETAAETLDAAFSSPCVEETPAPTPSDSTDGRGAAACHRLTEQWPSAVDDGGETDRTRTATRPQTQTQLDRTNANTQPQTDDESATGAETESRNADDSDPNPSAEVDSDD